MGQSLELEDVWELINHAKRINAGLALVAEQLDSDLQFVDRDSDAKKLGASGKDPKDAKGAQGVNVEKTKQYGGQLRRGYSVAFHFRNWQNQALATLMSIYDHLHDADISWNYCLAWPVMQLFTFYVKIHIQISQIPLLLPLVRVYLGCLRRLDVAEPSGRLLDAFLTQRAKVDAMSMEIGQFLSDQAFRKSFFGTTAPILVATMQGRVDWRMLDEMGHDGHFFTKTTLVLSHLTPFCEAFICYAVTHFASIQGDQVLRAAFQAICDNIGSLQLYGRTTVDVVALVKLFVQGSAAQQFALGSYQPTALMTELARRIKRFSDAATVDLSVLCAGYGEAFALMGLASFHLEAAFRRNLEGSNPVIVRLLYWLVRLSTQMTNAIPELKRFIVYNLREYDSAYVDSLSRSFALVQTTFDQLQHLSAALRGIDIEDYDKGQEIDLFPAVSFAGSVALALNKAATPSGIGHLAGLLELLAGLGWRMNLYMEPFERVMFCARLTQFWPYLPAIAALCGDSSCPAFEENAVGMQLCHFHCLEDVPIAESRGLRNRVVEHFDVVRARYSQVLAKVFDGARDGLLEGKLNERMTLLISVLTALRDMGVINIAGEERDPFQEVWDSLTAHASRAASRKMEDGPVALLGMLERTRTILQLAASAACEPFLDTMNTLMADFSQQGEAGRAIVKKYTDFARGVMKSGTPYSGTRLVFVGADLPAWTSPRALGALECVVDRPVLKEIYQELGQIVGQQAGPVFEGLAALTGKGKVDLEGICGASGAADVLQKLGYLGAIMQLRELFQPLAGTDDTPAVCESMRRVTGVQWLEGDKAADTLGWLMTSSYWDSFVWDTKEESVKDNAHLWSLFFDVALSENVAKTFYRQFFTKAAAGIQRATAAAKGKSKYPGAALLIVLDQMVRRSRITDCSDLSISVSPHYIRTVYADREGGGPA